MPNNPRSITTVSPIPGYTARTLRPGHDTPSTDDVVSVASEESLAISGPSQADALRLTALLADVLELGLELINLGLLLEVEDDDRAGGGSAQPVAVGGEDESVDLVVGVERVQVLALVKIPEHGSTVLATGGTEGSVGGDGDGVDVASVSDVVGLELAGRELPNLLFAKCQSSRIRQERASNKVTSFPTRIRACVLVSLPEGSEVANT